MKNNIRLSDNGQPETTNTNMRVRKKIISNGRVILNRSTVLFLLLLLFTAFSKNNSGKNFEKIFENNSEKIFENNSEKIFENNSEKIFENNYWGFFAHKRINRLAIFTLPAEMLPLYKTEIEYITDHAVDPDKRRYVSTNESYRHYIDLEHAQNQPHDRLDAQIQNTDCFIVTDKNDTLLLFDNKTIRHRKHDYFFTARSIKKIFRRDSIVVADSLLRRFAFNNLLRLAPNTSENLSVDSLTQLFKKEGLLFKNIKQSFVCDKLFTYGILPYHLQNMQRQLTEAFTKKDKHRILKVSAEMGHYIADAHVPLHTTENYDGQFTKQNGIHAFWESRLPELFADNRYDFFVGKANYIDSTRNFFWKIVLNSNKLVPGVLKSELAANIGIKDQEKFILETIGKTVTKKQTVEFSEAYHKTLNGMVEEQMRRAILALGSVWFTAWVDAGKPDLTNLKDTPPDAESIKEDKKMEEAFNAGKILGRKE